MYQRGPVVRRRHDRERGRVVQVNRCVESSGRRIERWGNLRANWIFFRITTTWYSSGNDKQRLQKLYDRLYSEVR
jgi:hypothetical protein